jgi:predicted transposase YdaD
MSDNKDIDSQQYKQTLKSVFPTQFEPGSLADRLLIQGREEGREEGREQGLEEGLEQGREQGKLAGKIQTLQELLGDAVSTDDELLSRDRETLTTELTALQARLRRRDA